jgi:hypothetical protein
MKNILVVEPNGDTSTNVLIFTTCSVEQIKRVLDFRNFSYSEIYAIKPEERQFYLFEPLWLDEKQEKWIRSIRLAPV